MTVTSFERHAVQRYFEGLVGCMDLTNWKSYRPNLQSYTLTATDSAALAPLLTKDAVALYIQALQSFAQALTGFQRNEFAWPIVKMYYAVFYSMRAELHASGVISVKNGNIYYMHNTAGNMFSSVQEKGSHQTYIKLRKTLPPSIIAHDLLLDNEVEPGKDVYSWMCANRERVNYHAKHFPDPEPDNVLQKVYDNYVKPKKLTDLFNLYESEILFCFDKDHTTMAVPYWKLRSCKNLLAAKATLDAVEQSKIDSVRSLLVSAGIDVAAVNRIVI